MSEEDARTRLVRYHVETERYDRESLGCPVGPRGEAIYIHPWQMEWGVRYARARAEALRIYEATKGDREWVSQFSYERLCEILEEMTA